MTKNYYKKFYFLAALYDLILGFGFLFFYKPIYAFLKMNLPNNPAYLTFCALFVGIYGVLLFMISKNITASKNMIIYAILIKIGFTSVILYYYFIWGKEYVDFPFQVLAIIDFAFALLFIQSLKFFKKL
jgi:hypothetical protein